MLKTSIFSFSLNVFYSSHNKFQIFSHFYFVVCKYFRLRQIKILLFGNELNDIIYYFFLGGMQRSHYFTFFKFKPLPNDKIFE